MPKRSNEFQSLIALIEETIAPEGVAVTESKEVISTEGTSREVDVAIEGTVAGHDILIGVECRDHRRKADITWIDQLVGKYQGLPVNKIIAVSKSGFSKNAAEAAKRNNIDTLDISEARNLRWRELVGHPAQPILAHATPVISFIHVATTSDSAEPDNILNVQLYRADGTPIGKLGDLCREAIQSFGQLKDDFRAALTGARPTMRHLMIREAQSSYWMAKDGSKQPVHGVKVSVEVRATHSPLSVETFNYRGIDVIHGKGRVFDKPVQVLLLNEQGDRILSCLVL